MRKNRNPAAVQKRKQESADREANSRGLTPKQRLALLDARLGPGVGATRERARLLAQIAAKAM